MTPMVAITGAGGFVGRWTVERLVGQGMRVRTLQSPAEDLSSPSSLRNFVAGAKVFVHLAGKNRASESEIRFSNVDCTLGLLQAIDMYGEKDALFLLASSLQVYKPTSLISLLREDAETDSSDTFSKSKLLAESAVREWSESGKIRGISMRIRSYALDRQSVGLDR